MRRNLLIIISSLLLVACQEGVVYTHFHAIPSYGWEADRALSFDATIADSITDYEMQITLRHTDKYPYQNLWLFVDICHDSTLLSTDTIECYLANERGEWLGGGMSIYELPLLYNQHQRFPNAGLYTISIHQGMRSDTLVGIQELGLKIISNEQK